MSLITVPCPLDESPILWGPSIGEGNFLWEGRMPNVENRCFQAHLFEGVWYAQMEDAADGYVRCLRFRSPNLDKILAWFAQVSAEGWSAR